MCICMCIYIHIFIYIYIEREREIDVDVICMYIYRPPNHTALPRDESLLGLPPIPRCLTTGVPRSYESPPPGGTYNSPRPRNQW